MNEKKTKEFSEEEKENIMQKNEDIKKFKNLVQKETRKIVLKERKIKKNKKIIKKTNELYMASKLEFKLL